MYGLFHNPAVTDEAMKLGMMNLLYSQPFNPYKGVYDDLNDYMNDLSSMFTKANKRQFNKTEEETNPGISDLNLLCGIMIEAANIEINGDKAKIFGQSKLNGAELMATDLRASVSLVLAALVAKGKTIINRIYHLDRGYEKIEKKLLSCGAQIKRLK